MTRSGNYIEDKPVENPDKVLLFFWQRGMYLVEKYPSIEDAIHGGDSLLYSDYGSPHGIWTGSRWVLSESNEWQKISDSCDESRNRKPKPKPYGVEIKSPNGKWARCANYSSVAEANQAVSDMSSACGRPCRVVFEGRAIQA